MLDFEPIPSVPGHFLLSLDTAWGKLRENPSPENMRGVIKDVQLSDSDVDVMKRPLRLVEVAESGEVSLPGLIEIFRSADLLQLRDITASSPTLLKPLMAALSHQSLMASPTTIASIDHYGELSIYPRWPGLEEDDDLAGQDGTAGTAADTDAPGVGGKTWTREELEKLSPKELGRLKSKGVDVGDLLHKKRKLQKGNAGG